MLHGTLANSKLVPSRGFGFKMRSKNASRWIDL